MCDLKVDLSDDKYHSCLSCHDTGKSSKYYQITLGDFKFELCEECVKVLTACLDSIIETRGGGNLKI